MEADETRRYNGGHSTADFLIVLLSGNDFAVGSLLALCVGFQHASPVGILLPKFDLVSE